MRLVPPAELLVLHQHFVVEEALSVIRHDLRNKLGSIRNAAFYVSRKIQKAAPELSAADPRVPELLGLIGSEIAATESVLETRLPPADRAGFVAAPKILQRVRDLVVMPPNIRVTVEATLAPNVRVGADEAAVAVFCLLENAVDAINASDGRGGSIKLGVGERDGHAALQVEDDGGGFAAGAHQRAFEPFFTTRAARLGIGLNIARRIATRWNGKLELAPNSAGGGGVRAALLLPTSST